MAFKVSDIFEGLIVPLSLTTYSSRQGVYQRSLMSYKAVT
jgi:hypothetical protein